MDCLRTGPRAPSDFVKFLFNYSKLINAITTFRAEKRQHIEFPAALSGLIAPASSAR